MKGGRKLSQWNLFVKKVYQEGKAKDKDYEFKQALEDASKRKSEMSSMKSSSSSSSTKSNKKSKKSKDLSIYGGKTRRRSMAMAGGKSRRRRRH